MLPQPAAEPAPPLPVRVEALHVGVVELVQGLARVDAPGHEDEVEAVHPAPVLLEPALVPDGLPQRRAVKGGELGHVHVVQAQGEDEVAGRADGGLGLAGQAHHEEALGAQPRGLDAPDRLPDFLEVDAGLVLRHQVRVAGLDAQRDHQAAGPLEHGQQLVVGVAHPHGAVELQPQGPGAQPLAERGDALAVQGEEVVVDVDVAHAEARAQVLHVGVDVVGRVVAEALPEDRAVAIGALVGTAPAGHHGGAGGLDIAEQGQMVALGETGQLVVGREGQAVQVRDRRPGRIGHRPAMVAPGQPVDLGGRPPAGQLRQGALPLAQAQVVDVGEVVQQPGAQGRDVHPAEDDRQVRPRGLEPAGQIVPVQKAGGGG